jgi:hyperosmotically inducible periplasmic protein
MPTFLRQYGLTAAFVVVIGVIAPQAALAQWSDGDLAERALAAARRSPHFSIFDDITVESRQGFVTVSGCVTQPYKRDDLAARIAKVDGVRGVTNEIKVLPASPADAALRMRIAQAIYSHPSFWRYASMASPPIHIIVDQGRVTLTGPVTSEAERTLAFTLAHVAGATQVTNKLQLASDRGQS